MYKLAILDLDGTILDTIGDLDSALNHTLETFSLPCITTEKTRSLVGRGLRNLVKDASGSTDEDMISKCTPRWCPTILLTVWKGPFRTRTSPKHFTRLRSQG